VGGLCECVCVVVVEMPEKRLSVSSTLSVTSSLCQETVIKWFANYNMALKSTSQQPQTKSR